MEDYKALIKQINEYDMLMKDLLEKRMLAMKKIALEDNEGEEDYLDCLHTDSSYPDEYGYFTRAMNALDRAYRYGRQQKSFSSPCMTGESSIDTVCYQGIPFSYSESTSKALFPGKKLTNRESFEDVFRDVYGGFSDIGVIPMENSTSGYINEVYDLLLKYDLYINYNYIKKVDHCIAGPAGSSFKDVKEVHSHPQALMQCREYLEKHGLKAVNEINTAVAAKKIHELNKQEIACICSPEAAAYYGLTVFDSHINKEQNYTRFGAISKHLLCQENHDKISIVFSVPHKTGSLHDVLSIFSYHNINLAYIYSRPDLKSPWKYLFYLDFEGSILDNKVAALLNQLEEELPFLKILGSFKA